MAGQSHNLAAKPRAGLTAELNGCDKAEQSQAVWAGEPSGFFLEGPQIMEVELWNIPWLIGKRCWDLYYLIIFGDYDRPSDWETEITFHY
jgi:hypothetical protein